MGQREKAFICLTLAVQDISLLQFPLLMYDLDSLLFYCK